MAPRIRTAEACADARPLTTRECADHLGLSTDWILNAIDRGVVTPRGRVKLEAEVLTTRGRRCRRIHLDRFINFLRAIGWKRLPAMRAA